MLVLNQKKSEDEWDISSPHSLVNLCIQLIIFTVIILLHSYKLSYTAYFIIIPYFLLLLFAVYHYINKKRVTFDKELITLEEFILSYRFRGKQGRAQDVKYWYTKDINQSHSDGMEIYIVFESGKKIVIQESQFDDFFELRKLLTFDDLYKDKKSTWRR